MKLFGVSLFLLALALNSLQLIKALKYAEPIEFTIINDAKKTIAIGVYTSVGEVLGGGGFELRSNQQKVLKTRGAFTGHIFARTDCNMPHYRGECLTGGKCKNPRNNWLNCSKSDADVPKSPRTTVTIQQTVDRRTVYFINLERGFNLDVTVEPYNNEDCDETKLKCFGIRDICPDDLKVDDGYGIYGPNARILGCKSTCMKLKTDEACCTGPKQKPAICTDLYKTLPNNAARKFKAQCKDASVYKYDGARKKEFCVTEGLEIRFS